MKTIVFNMLLIAIVGAIASSCLPNFNGIKAKGPIKKEIRKLAAFTKVDAGVSGDVHILIGDEYKVEIEAPENILAVIETTIKDNQLDISFKKNVYGVNKLNIWVTAPSYEALELSGSGNMVVENAINSDKFYLALSGSGDVFLEKGTFQEVNAEISGSGSLNIAGSATSAALSVTGSGDLDADNLLVQKGNCEITGSGTINCSVSDELVADITGSGNVNYKGTPRIKSAITGSGEISAH